MVCVECVHVWVCVYVGSVCVYNVLHMCVVCGCMNVECGCELCVYVCGVYVYVCVCVSSVHPKWGFGLAPGPYTS